MNPLESVSDAVFAWPVVRANLRLRRAEQTEAPPGTKRSAIGRCPLANLVKNCRGAARTAVESDGSLRNLDSFWTGCAWP
jgi:hypothetical protein